MNKKGFTLIELLIVISIIGILVSIVSVSFTTSQKQARDVQRKSDLVQYRTALESYANANNGLYPYMSTLGGTPMVDVCITPAFSRYASSCPDDPKTGSNWYVYYSDGGPLTGDPTATKYLIYIANGLEAVSKTTWVVCSNGKTGAVALADSDPWTDIYYFCF